MATPTTRYVMATEDLPAVYRPGNQINLVPSQATNDCASQAWMPGMGEVRSGSPMTTGIAPAVERQFAQQMMPGMGSWNMAAMAAKAHAAAKQPASTAMVDMSRQLIKGPSLTEVQKQRALEAARAQAAKAQGLPRPQPYWMRRTTVKPKQPSKIKSLVSAGSWFGLTKASPAPTGVEGFWSDELIPRVPNWALVAAAAGLATVLVVKKLKK